jgi:type IV secretion system protein VirD4
MTTATISGDATTMPRSDRKHEVGQGLLLGWTLTQLARPPIGFVPSPALVRKGHPTQRQALSYNQEGHLLTVAPTGAGKGTSCIIPALLTYPGQVIVIDPKGEAYRVTARWRQRLGQRVIRLDPFGVIDRTTDALNPLDLFDLTGTSPDDEARTVAELLTGGQHSTKDPFWDQTAHALISGLCGWLATSVPREERRLSRLRELFGHGDLPYTLAALLDNKKVLSADARQEFVIFLHHPERETRPSIQSTAAQHLSHFGSVAVQRATDCSTFALQDVIDGTPLSIFIIVPPTKLQSHRNLLRLWIGTLLLALATRQRQPPQRTLFLIDEAAQLGSLSVLHQAITLYRAYGVSVWSFWQDVSQLRTLYPDSWPTILNNAAVVQLFGPRNQRMAEEFASLVGGIDGQTVMRLITDQQLMLINGAGPSICQRPNYLHDALFAGRYDPNPLYADPSHNLRANSIRQRGKAQSR